MPRSDRALRRPPPTRSTRPPERARSRRPSERVEKSLARYKGRIEAAKDFREREGYDDLWERLNDLYRGKHFNLLNVEDRIAVNISFSTINVIYPSVSVNHPKVTVMARAPEDEDRATILEAVINYWWRHYKIRPEFRLAVKDFLVFGHGWLKTGYRFVEEDVDLDDDELTEAYDESRAEADAYAEANPELAGDLPTDDEIYDGLPRTQAVVVEDRPFVERVSPNDMLVDPDATHMGNLRWIAQKSVRTLEEVRDDERYDARVRRNVKPDSESRWGARNKRGDDRYRKSDDVKRVTIWEFYDITDGHMCVFAEGGDDYLVAPMRQPYVFGHPYVMLRNYDVPDFFYPMGDLEALEPIQQELNKTRSQMMQHRKRFIRKYLYDETAFDPAGRQALASDEDNTMVPVKNTVRPLRELVVPIEQVPLPPDFYQQSEIIENDADRVTGINEYMQGSLPEIRRTATEAAIINDAANARAADKLAIIEEVIGQVAENLVQLAQQYLESDQVVRVMGSNGSPIWVPFTPEDIEGEYDFEVEGGSTQPLNDTVRRQNAIQMVQVLAPFMQTGVLNPIEFLRHILREGFGIKQAEKFLQPMMMGAPVGPEGAPTEEGLPPEGGAPTVPPQQAGLDPATSTVDAIPPELLAQLSSQTGLRLA